MAARNPQLEAAIRAAPDDDGYLVYGDWLQAHGDPRGELVMIDRELAHGADGERARWLRTRRRQLMAKHADDILGALADADPADVALDWHLGFVRRVRLRHFYADGARARSVLRAALASPACALLQSLELPAVASPDGGAEVAQVVDELVSAPRPGLRSLSLGRLVPRPGAALEWPRVGPLDALSRALPDLTTLDVCGRDVRLTDTSLPALRALRLRVAGAGPDLCGDLAGAALPALERLELWLCLAEHPARVAYACLRSLPPTVAHLGLRSSEDTGAIAAHVAAHIEETERPSRHATANRGGRTRRGQPGRLAPLSSIDLSGGTLTDGDIIARIAGHSTRPAIDVSDNYLDEADQRRLAGLGNVRLGFQDPTDEAPVALIPRRVLGHAIQRRILTARGRAVAGDRAGAEALYLGALELARTAERIALEDGVIRSLYRLYSDHGRLADAEVLVRDRLGADADTATATDPWHVELARVRTRRGDHHHAIELLERVLAERERVRPPQLHPGLNIADAELVLARAYAGLLQWDRAVAVAEGWARADDADDARTPGRAVLLHAALAASRGARSLAADRLARARSLLERDADADGLARLERCAALIARAQDEPGPVHHGDREADSARPALLAVAVALGVDGGGHDSQ